MLTLTSLLGLGVERLAMLLVAQRGTRSVAAAVRPLIGIRLVTAPAVAVGLWLLLAFVHVRLTLAAGALTVIWIVAAQVLVVAAAGLRAVGNLRAEPIVTPIARAIQAILLVGCGAAGAGVTVLVAALASVEILAAVTLLGVLAPWWGTGSPASQSQGGRLGGWRRAAALAGIETVSLCYLRADLLVVGHLVGAAAGATYGLLYRVVDGAGGAAGTASLGLFAAAAAERDGGDRSDGVRARSLAVMPLVAGAVAVIAVVAAGPFGRLIPRLGGETGTLRVLIAATPLLVWNALELHVRAARGRHGEVLRIGLAACVVNVALCVWLVDAHGLVGAAIALLVTETLQAVLLVAGSSRSEASFVRSTGAFAAMVTAALLALTGALS
jgi:O-antigen/teichoic acid export membrane protein